MFRIPACTTARALPRRRVFSQHGSPTEGCRADGTNPSARGRCRPYLCVRANLRVDVVSAASDATAEHACLVVQQPDFLGTIGDIEVAAKAAHDAGALCVVMADPFALGILRAPGEGRRGHRDGRGARPRGADDVRRFLAGVVQRTQRVPAPDAGAHCRADEGAARPSRRGRRGVAAAYGLRADTSGAGAVHPPRAGHLEHLDRTVADAPLRFAIAVQALGPRGLREAAELCYQRAHDAARRIEAPGFEVTSQGPWFQEFPVRGPLPASELRAQASRSVGNLTPASMCPAVTSPGRGRRCCSV